MSRSSHRPLVRAATASGLGISLLAAPNARAASGEEALTDGAESAGTSTTVIAVLGTTTTAALVFLTVKLADDDSPPPPPEKKAEAAKAAAAYLLANHAQLRQDLARGTGPVVADLAEAANVPAAHVERFGALLRKDRAELLSLADRAQLTPDRAYEFFERVSAACSADPVIGAARKAARAARGS